MTPDTPSAPPPYTDKSPDSASIEGTIALCRDDDAICSSRKVIELCESVLALRARLAEVEKERDEAQEILSVFDGGPREILNALVDMRVAFGGTDSKSVARVVRGWADAISAVEAERDRLKGALSAMAAEFNGDGRSSQSQFDAWRNAKAALATSGGAGKEDE